MKKSYIIPNVLIVQLTSTGMLAASSPDSVNNQTSDASQLVKEDNSGSWSGNNTSVWDNEW